MKRFTESDVRHIYDQLIGRTQIYASRHNWQTALNRLESAARWAYNFNLFYRDNKAEQLLVQIAEETVGKICIAEPINTRYSIIDSFCLDNRGLTQQYVRAIIRKGLDLLYICTSSDTSSGKAILSELENYPKARIVLLANEDDQIEKAQRIVHSLNEYRTAHILLHMAPWDTVPLLACHSVEGARIYNINLTDHAYWMGSALIDYNIEFRPYGVSVSVEKRGLKESQLLMLPYYPINPVCQEFGCLPQFPEKGVKVLTGGALYKMLGKKDIFFQLMDLVLDISPQVYIYVAGFSPDPLFDKGCSKMQHRNRVIQLGIRNDIDALFEVIDIYLGTYPTTGALMSQYAAKHGKPIIAYHDEGDVMNDVAEFVNHYSNDYCSFSDIAKLKEYARHLILDESFRQTEGEKLKAGLMTAEKFADGFLDIIGSLKSSWALKKDVINYRAFFQNYLDLENNYGHVASKTLFRELKLEVFRFSGYRIYFMVLFFTMAFKKLTRHS